MKSRRQAGGVACAAVDGNTSSGGRCGSKMERKDVEKNRRLHMKGLCLKLSYLVPATSTHHIRQYQSSNTSSQSNNNNKPNHFSTAPLTKHVTSALRRTLSEFLGGYVVREEGELYYPG